MLQELTELFSKQGYEGKYLTRQVLISAMGLAAFANKMNDAEYFLMRVKQVDREIRVNELAVGITTI